MTEFGHFLQNQCFSNSGEANLFIVARNLYYVISFIKGKLCNMVLGKNPANYALLVKFVVDSFAVSH